MLSAPRGSFLYRFGGILTILGFWSSFGGGDIFRNMFHFLEKQHKMISVGRGAFLYYFEVILTICDFAQWEGSTSHPVR